MFESTRATAILDEPWDVVILGAGYAGVMAAARLGRYTRNGRMRVLLVNPDGNFVERVRLQEVAATSSKTDRVFALAELLAGTRIDILQSKVLKIDPVRRLIFTDNGITQSVVRFNRAIVTTGLETCLKSVACGEPKAYRMTAVGPYSVSKLRNALSALGGGSSRVLVVGAGITGIELASAIRTHWPQLTVALADRKTIGSFATTRTQALLREELELLEIELYDNAVVEEIGENSALLRDGRRINFNLSVVCAGWSGPAFLREAGLAVSEAGRMLVDNRLRSTSHPHLLAAGDVACPVETTGAPYRPSAFVALVSGAHAADVVAAEFSGVSARGLSFATFGQGIALGRRGIGFATYPADVQRGPIFTGAFALRLRDVFLRVLMLVLKLERRRPGSFAWIRYPPGGN